MSKEPWLIEETPWKSEAEFWNWVKGAIRKGWARHPIRVIKIRRNRKKLPLGRKTKKNPEGMVWACQCEICSSWVRQSNTEVDHIKSGDYKEKWYEDIEGFVRRMYLIDFEDLQLLCKPCHKIKSLADRCNCSFERAKYIEKPRIEFSKKKAKEQLDILRKLSIIPLKTKEQRVKQYLEWLEEQVFPDVTS